MAHPLRFGVIAGGGHDGPGLSAAARQLEAWGYGCIYAGDHLAGRWMESFTLLTWAAASTSQLRVATLVAANDFRNPVMLAKAAATLDHLSGGRFQLGLGAGWWDRDYAMLGIPFDPPGERIERMEEAIEILRLYWQGEPFDFEGGHYRLRGIEPGPRTTAPGRLPLMIGGGGPRVMAVAGRSAAVIGPNPRIAGGRISGEFFSQLQRKDVAKKLGWARRAAEQAGRDPAELVFQSAVNYLAVTESEAEAVHLRESIAAATGLAAGEVAQAPSVLVGTPAGLRERILRDRDELGFTDWVLPVGEIRGFGLIDRSTFERFAADVMPGLA
jgi:probable F420-dependent oxidoreductase